MKIRLFGKIPWILLSSVFAFCVLRLSLFSFSYAQTLDSFCHMGVLTFVLNVVVIYSVLAAIGLLTNRVPATALLGCVASVLIALVNESKLSQTSQPIKLDDIYALSNTQFLMRYVPSSPVVLVATIVGVALLVILAGRLRRAQGWTCRTDIFRLGGFIVSLVTTLCLVYCRELNIAGKIEDWGVRNILSDPTTNYRHNGMAVTAAINLTNNLIKTPPRYNSDLIDHLLKSTRNFSHARAVSNPAEETPVTLIFYMMESLWDPMSLPIEFDRDPIANFRQIQSQGISGSLIAPVFGGGTANTEFEVLTGLSTLFLPDCSIVYNQFLKRNTESFATLARENGYRTVALHNGSRTFYSRDKAYRYLGFDDYIAVDAMGSFDSWYGLPPDSTLVDKLSTFLAKDDGNPLFLHAITVQGHGPFEPTRPAEIKVLSNVHPRAKARIESYATSMHRADLALGQLVEAIKKSPRRVLLVAYGDHLPALGKDYRAYIATKYLSTANPGDWSPEDWIKMRKTPLAIWSNYGLRHQNLAPISANCLTSQAIRLTNLRSDEFHTYLYDVCEKFPVLTEALALDSRGNVLQSGHQQSREYPQEVRDYRIMGFDRLFGQGYSFRETARQYQAGLIRKSDNG